MFCFSYYKNSEVNEIDSLNLCQSLAIALESGKEWGLSVAVLKWKMESEFIWENEYNEFKWDNENRSEGWGKFTQRKLDFPPFKKWSRGTGLL